MPHGAIIFPATRKPPSIGRLRALAPGAELSGFPAEAGPRVTVRWPDVTVSVEFLGPAAALSYLAQLSAYTGSPHCELLEFSLDERIEKARKAVIVRIDPGFDAPRKAIDFVYGLATLLDGMVELDRALFAANGLPLAAPRSGGPRARRDASPPDAARVARRALVLAAVGMRCALELRVMKDAAELRRGMEAQSRGELLAINYAGTFAAAHDELLVTIRRVVESLATFRLEAEVQPLERLLLGMPVGTPGPQALVNGAWLGEGVAVLAWALGLAELPPHDVEADVFQLAGRLGIGTPAPAVLAAPALRPHEELSAQCRRLLGIHWRLRELLLKPTAPVDFRAFSETSWFGGFDLTGMPLAKGDLAVGGVPVTEAPPHAVALARSVAFERHRAINWLLEGGALYAEVDTST